MRENDFRARHERRYKVSKESKHGFAVADDVLDRNFTPLVFIQVWSSYIMYLWTDEIWVYPAIVLDLFKCEVIGWLLARATYDGGCCGASLDDNMVPQET